MVAVKVFVEMSERGEVGALGERRGERGHL